MPIDYFVDLHVRAFEDHSGAHMAPGFCPGIANCCAASRRKCGAPAATRTSRRPTGTGLSPAARRRSSATTFWAAMATRRKTGSSPAGRSARATGRWPTTTTRPTTNSTARSIPTRPLFKAGLQRRFNQNRGVDSPTAADVAGLLEAARADDVAPYDTDRRHSPQHAQLSGGFLVEGSGGARRCTTLHVWRGSQMQTGFGPSRFSCITRISTACWALWQARYGDGSYPTEGPHNDWKSCSSSAI